MRKCENFTTQKIFTVTAIKRQFLNQDQPSARLCVGLSDVSAGDAHSTATHEMPASKRGKD